MKRSLALTHLAILITFAVVIHTVEAALPLPMPVPGVRLGLANIITLLTLLFYGFSSGLLVAVLRVVLGSLFAGNFLGAGFWLALTGGAAACAVMALALVLERKGVFSLVSVSILGAVTHNLVQLAVASLLVSSFSLLRGYFPLLLLLALPTGFFTGLAAFYLENLGRRVIRQPGSERGG